MKDFIPPAQPKPEEADRSFIDAPAVGKEVWEPYQQYDGRNYPPNEPSAQKGETWSDAQNLAIALMLAERVCPLADMHPTQSGSCHRCGRSRSTDRLIEKYLSASAPSQPDATDDDVIERLDEWFYNHDGALVLSMTEDGDVGVFRLDDCLRDQESARSIATGQSVVDTLLTAMEREVKP